MKNRLTKLMNREKEMEKLDSYFKKLDNQIKDIQVEMSSTVDSMIHYQYSRAKDHIIQFMNKNK